MRTRSTTTTRSLANKSPKLVVVMSICRETVTKESSPEMQKERLGEAAHGVSNKVFLIHLREPREFEAVFEQKRAVQHRIQQRRSMYFFFYSF
jgi:hypothetical protein